MKQLSYYFRTENHFTQQVIRHTFTLRCLPRDERTQYAADASLRLFPEVPYTLQRDAFGNAIQSGHIALPHDSFTYMAVGRVTVDQSIPRTGAPHPMYRYPSGLTALSEEIKAAVHDMRLSGQPRDKAMRIMQELHSLLNYNTGTTTVSTTAAQAFQQKCGVCQDYAHIMIAMLRECAIPARYVSGLSIGEGATHAWVDVSIDGCWVGMDPTRCQCVNDDYLIFSVGRDAGDCPVDRAVFYGLTGQSQTVYTKLVEQ